MKKIMLLTGSTKGLGGAIKEKFQNEYEIVGIARSGADYNGDLKDSEFRKKILSEVNPSVVINNAGICTSAASNIEIYLLNLIAAIDLTRGYAKKMTTGHIINISSVSAGLGLAYSISDTDIDYVMSKKALSDFTQLFQFIQTKNLKICSIEPGFIMTDMGDITRRFESQDGNDYISKRKIVPLKPAYVAGVIDWILKQPEDVVVSSIRLMNQCYG